MRGVYLTDDDILSMREWCRGCIRSWAVERANKDLCEMVQQLRHKVTMLEAYNKELCQQLEEARRLAEQIRDELCEADVVINRFRLFPWEEEYWLKKNKQVKGAREK